MSALRRAVERRSSPLLVVLSRQPRVLLALAAVALFAGLLLLPAVPAAACFAVLLGFVGWLCYLSWPALDGRARLVRVLVLLGLAVLGVQHVAG